MKKILVISNYWHFPFEKSSSRYNTIIELLSNNQNYDVELVTSNFRHITKSFRNYSENKLREYKYKVTFINEIGYKKNISLKRIFSHKIFAKNLKKYLQTKEDIDVIYSFVPSLSANKVVAKYCKKNSVKYVIDILDLWPEAFKMVINIPIISDIIFYPMKMQADYIYKCADEIIAVSETYVNRGLSVNKKLNKGTSVFIGIDLKFFDECKKNNAFKYNNDIIRIAYIGTLGTSYDIKSIIDAIKILNDRGINNVKFLIIGDGPLKEDFKNYAKSKQISFEFTGKLDYEKMVGLLSSCDIAVNPIIGLSVSSMINKVGDYAAAGLPVVNTQNSQEYRDLIDEYEAGFNCENGNSKDVADKLQILINDKKMRKKIGRNNRKLAEERFDRDKTYNKIIEVIERK